MESSPFARMLLVAVAVVLSLSISSKVAAQTNFSIESVSISTNPASPSLTVGSTGMVTLTCSVVLSCSGTCDDASVTISWTKDNAPVFTESSGTITSLTPMLNASVPITGIITASDAGSYQCHADLPSLDPVPSNSEVLTVTIPSTLMPTVSLTPASSTVEVGSSVTLTCSPSLSGANLYNGANVNFRYMRGSSELRNVNKGISGGTLPSDDLVQSIDDTSSAGTHTCTVTINGGSSSTITGTSISGEDTAEITAQIPSTLMPTVSLTPASSTVEVGSSVTLACSPSLPDATLYNGANVNFQFEYGSSELRSMNKEISGGTLPSDNLVLSIDDTSSAGTYTCTVTINGLGSSTITGTSTTGQDNSMITAEIPSTLMPTVSLTPASSTVEVGSSVTLTCSPSLPDATLYNGANVNFRFEYGSSELHSMNKEISGGTLPSDNLVLSIDDTSSAGTYTCTVTINGLGSLTITGASTTGQDNSVIIAQIPSDLMVTVELTPLFSMENVGSSVTLTCSPSLSGANLYIGANVNFRYLYGGSELHNEDKMISSGNVPTDSLDVTIDTSSAGPYTCTVTINGKGISTITGSSEVGQGVAQVFAQDLSPTSLLRLDISPFNNFFLECSVSGSSITPSFAWSENNMQVPEDTDLSNYIVVMQPSTSTLFVTLKQITPGTEPAYNYQCTATIPITGNGMLSSTATAMVSVRGAAPPNQPQLDNVDVFPEKAVIHFTVTAVAYDPETYTILLGTSPQTLKIVDNAENVTSSHGLAFLEEMNIMYSITVDGLDISQMYYYVIVAANSHSTTNSTMSSFTTDETSPGPPSSVTLRIDTASSLYLSWGEPDEPNGQITEYSYTCYVTSNQDMMIQSQAILDPNITSAKITGGDIGLAYYTNYTCSVTAFTGAGEGEPALVTALSAQAAPNGAPLHFTAVSTDSMIIILSWSLPEESERNGEIVHYEYMCQDVHTSFQQTSEVNATIVGLTPFTNYTCSVSAATMNGTGPAAAITTTTAEDIPGPVNSLSVSGENSTSFMITWTSPSSPEKNGIISRYYIVATFISNGSFVRDMRLNVTEAVEESTEYSESFEGLVRYIPYNVSVFAATSAGNGTKVSQTEFTEQGTPGPVTIESVNRINSTHMTVTWTPLTLEQARGFVAVYTVRATPVVTSRRRQDATQVTKEFPANVNSGTLTTLQKGVTYSVTVTATTSEGEGEVGAATTVMPIPDGGIHVAALVIVLCALITFAILVVIVIMLVVCYRSQRNVKLHMMTVKENPSAFNDFTNGTKNGASIELKGMEKVEEVDDQRNQPIPVSEFAAHVNSLHARRDLGFEEEYSAFKNNPQGPYTVSKLPHNAVKNRFENVFPFDCARVELSPVNGEVGSDYINASWMDGYRKEKAYIAAQGPLEKTIADFWRMVWEFQLPTIVMLTELVERAIEKCSCYWPRSINQTLEVGSGLRVTLIEQRAYVEYKLKKIILFNTAEKEGGKLEVTHYHFTAWPDHGVPADKTCMLAFIKRIRKAHPPMGPPLVVHCSAGVGRTGTFITLDTMLQRMEDGQDLNVYQFIKQMRTKRVLMVQTEAQYTYIHDALAEYITCGDTSIEATSASVFKRMEDLEKVTDHKTGYQCQFELLGDISIKASDGLCSEALHTQNVNKNRYRESLNALPFNYNRVRLKTMTGPGDYINASIVDGYKHRGAFLATQAPLENTVDDFWRMVWESQSMAIVMLYDVNEGSGSDERKLCQYWPTNPGEEKPYGKMLVKLVSEKEQTHYTLRKLELRMESTYINLASGGDKGDKFIVTQYQYRKWPESGKPPEPLQILRLIENLIKTQSNTGNKAITVICSDGIGRTGAFVCIYSVLERVKTEAVADIFQFIKSSRFQRAGLVKELDQYIFCHEMLQEFLSTFDNYANFEVKR